MKKLLLVIDAQKSFINEITEPYVKKIQELVNSTDKYRDREIKASKDFGIKLDEEKTKVLLP